MKNGAYYGIDFGTTNTSVYLYHYEKGVGSRETGFGTDGKDLQPFSSCIAISTSGKHDVRYGREVKENINSFADYYGNTECQKKEPGRQYAFYHFSDKQQDRRK